MESKGKLYKRAVSKLEKILSTMDMTLCRDEESEDLYIPISGRYEDNIWVDFEYEYKHVVFTAYNRSEVSRWDVKGVEQFFRRINEVNSKSIAKLVYSFYDDDYIGMAVRTEVLLPKSKIRAGEYLKFYFGQMMMITFAARNEYDKLDDCVNYFDLSKGHVNLPEGVEMFKAINISDVLECLSEMNSYDEVIQKLRFKYQGEEFIISFREDDARISLKAENFYSFDRYDEEKLNKVRETINFVNYNRLHTTSYSYEGKMCNVSAETIVLFTEQESFKILLKTAIFNFIWLKRCFLRELDYFDYKRNKTKEI